MKKILSIVAVAAMLFFAGNANAQMTFRAGYQNLNLEVSGSGTTTYTNDGADGFYVGLDYNINLSSAGFGVAPGVNFSYFSDMMDVRVPVMFNWSEDVGNIIVGVGLGPIFTYGLGGEMYSDYGTKRFDFAVGAMIWLGYKQVRLEGGYDYGLLNRFDGTGGYKWTFNRFFVGLGYTL